MEGLISNIKNNTICVEIAGLVYIGLPLAIVFSKMFYTVDVNLALVNKLALIFKKNGIYTWKVIDTDSSKPYGLPSILDL